jgi:hypothetical protein
MQKLQHNVLVSQQPLLAFNFHLCLASNVDKIIMHQRLVRSSRNGCVSVPTTARRPTTSG